MKVGKYYVIKNSVVNEAILDTLRIFCCLSKFKPTKCILFEEVQPSTSSFFGLVKIRMEGMKDSAEYNSCINDLLEEVQPYVQEEMEL